MIWKYLVINTKYIGDILREVTEEENDKTRRLASARDYNRERSEDQNGG